MGSAGSQALRAAVAVGRRVGLPVRDPVVLSDAFNLVVHLAPSPVVARVPTVTARLRPDVLEWVRREIAVGTHLDATTDLADPGPHRHGGFVVGLWRHLAVDRERRPTAQEAGRALAALHTQLRSCPVELPRLGPPFADIDAVVTAPGLAGLDRADAEQLGREAAALRERLLPDPEPAGSPAAQVLHGDAHPGNLVAAPAGWRWVDLEETCRGPVRWDLAVLRGTRRLDGAAAVAAYALALGLPPVADAELADLLALRRLQARCAQLLLASDAVQPSIPRGSRAGSQPSSTTAVRKA